MSNPLPLAEDSTQFNDAWQDAEDELSDDTAHGDAEEPDEAADSDGPSATRKTSGRREKARVTAGAVRQIISKHQDLQAAPDVHRQILASSLGVRDDAIDITTHLVQAVRVQLVGFTELNQILDVADDPFEAMAKALQYASVHRQLWTILTGLGVADGNLPGKESKAAMQIAQACTKVGDTERSTIDAVRALARKA